MCTNRDYKSLKLSPLNLGGLVKHELDKTKDPHCINTRSKYNVVFFAETRMSRYQFILLVIFMYIQLVDQSLDITTCILVDFAFCVNMAFFYTLK